MSRLFVISTILSFVAYWTITSVLAFIVVSLAGSDLGTLTDTLIRIAGELLPYVALIGAGLVAARFGGHRSAASAFVAVLAGEICRFISSYGLPEEMINSVANMASLMTHAIAVSLVAAAIAHSPRAKVR